ncbi:hypothetical protein ACO0SA_003644 [Hanseniaspora valbyensis]
MVKLSINGLFRVIRRYQNGLYKNISDGKTNNNLFMKTPSSIKYPILLLLIISCSLIYSLVFVPFEGADSPSCRSIYMYPSYAKLNDMDSFLHTRFASKYHLYLYREQGVDPEPISSSNEILVDGIPVLFIPGNAGSFKQGRSIAAQAANYYYSKDDQILASLKDKQDKRNLDFYTLDFNEDFTAFHGQTMLDQAEFVNDCIQFILSLYKSSKKTNDNKYGPLPSSVIIVGHSMGGIVSRVLPLLDNYLPESINTILTLSSPHSLSPLTFDGDLLKVYKQIDEFWVKEFNDLNSFSYNNISLISITGGILDDVLPSDYTLLESILNDATPLNNGLTVYTSGIPKVWTSIDHLAIVWCDQLRKVLAKSLLEIVDKNSPTKTLELKKRMDIFQTNLLDNNVLENNKILSNIIDDEVVDVSKSTQLKFIGDSVSLTSLNDIGTYILPLDSLKISSIWDLEITLHSESLDKVDMLLCDGEFNCQKISDLFKDIPNSKFETLEESTASNADKSLGLINETIKKFQFLTINIKKKLNSNISINKFNTDNNVNLKFVDLLFFGKKLPVNRNINLQLFNIYTSLSSNIAFKLVPQGVSIKHETYPLIKQFISEPYETKWHILKSTSKHISITTAANPPYIPTKTNKHLIQLKLFNNDNEVHSLKIKIDFKHTLKLIIRRYRLSLATLPVTLISIIFLFQIREFVITGNFSGLGDSLRRTCSFITYWGPVLCVVIEMLLQFDIIKLLLNFVDCVKVNDNLFNKSYSKFQKNEFLGNGSLSLDSIFIDYLVLMLSLGLVMLLGGLILLVENLINKCKKNEKHETTNDESKEKINKSSLKQILSLGRVIKFFILIVAVFFYVPYQLVFTLLTISHLFYVIFLFISSSPKINNKNTIEFNKTVLLMMLFILPICIPIDVVFLHNFAVNWKTPFRSHHNVLAIFPIISLVFCLQNGMMLKQEKNFNFRSTCFLLAYICFFGILFGVRNTYFIYHLFNLLACILCIGMF